MSPDFLRNYNHYTNRASAAVMAEYSTSFSLATRLLQRRTRRDIRNLYAVVRIADELVDGVAAQAGLGPAEITDELNNFEQEIYRAMRTGFSTNPAVHAFADSARRCRINPEYIAAFFVSMRQDVAPKAHDAQSLDTYIWGSAEVIGLMCLAVFTAESPLPAAAQQACEQGARRLGAALQKINFLRDLGEDRTTLGRDYLGANLDTARRDALVAEISADLDAAFPSIALLPLSARAGVLAAFLLFRELTRRLSVTPVDVMLSTRVRVPGVVKARLVARAIQLAPRLTPQLKVKDV